MSIISENQRETSVLWRKINKKQILMKKICFFSKKGLTDFQFYDIIIYVAEEISNN